MVSTTRSSVAHVSAANHDLRKQPQRVCLDAWSAANTSIMSIKQQTSFLNEYYSDPCPYCFSSAHPCTAATCDFSLLGFSRSKGTENVSTSVDRDPSVHTFNTAPRTQNYETTYRASDVEGAVCGTKLQNDKRSEIRSCQLSTGL
jgi:hypothetical protein